MPPPPASIGQQFFWLIILAIPVAVVSRTVVYEELFREPRDWCTQQSRICSTFFARKFFYLFTCEYCFSHYGALFFLLLTQFRLLIDDWRGYVISFFALVFVANTYLNLYSRLRVDIASEKTQIQRIKTEIKQIEGDDAKPVESHEAEK